MGVPPVGGSTLPGAVWRAPLGVAEGDGMDWPHADPAAPAKTTPGNTFREPREESGKWHMKSLGKAGKIIMIICLE